MGRLYSWRSGTSVPAAAPAGAATAPYTVAIAGCFEQAGVGTPTIGAYIEVQAYGLPSSAYLTESDGSPNTAFFSNTATPPSPAGHPGRRSQQWRAVRGRRTHHSRW